MKEALKHFEQFYEEIFLELADFGELKDLSVVDNLGDHLIGNVYARYNDEESAEKAFNALAGKYYHSSLVQEEYSPIVSMKDCKCRKYEEGICIRGAFCNFLHLKEVNKSLLRSLKDEMYETHPEYKKNRNNNLNKKKAKKHENSSSESSLDKYDNFKRKKIIHKWNVDFMTEKKNNDKKKKIDQTKIDLAILEKKLRNKQFEEDLKKNEQKKKKSEKEEKVDSDDEETITNEEGNK